MNPLRELNEYGQSVWLDYIRRQLISGGELAHLIEADGLRGLTSNPTIFRKAIAGSDDYDDTLRHLLEQDPDAEPSRLFERLAVEDVTLAADAFRPLYEESDGAHGYVSIEVSPYQAGDTGGTIEEARRLWGAVDRPNVMIKVPATPEGIPAIEALLAEGINVNITLMFSLDHYEKVAEAYLRGLERCDDPSRVASVASFFVSRVDRAVDARLDELGSDEAAALRGTIAIANAKLAYRRFREIFSGDRFAALRERGARVQRVLWASTSTKDPAYRDVLYVEELIGPDTVNTMPPATLNAFRDHGRVRPSLEEGLDEAEEKLGRLSELGIDLDMVTEELQRAGVESFADSFDALMEALQEKRAELVAAPAQRQRLSLGELSDPFEMQLERWREERAGPRLWEKDPTLWFEEPVPEITDRLGWLTLPEDMHGRLDELREFAVEVREEGVRDVVLLGMGGSSLAPEVFSRIFGSAPGHPTLTVLDSTHPGAVRSVEERIPAKDTLFIVASKSGTTLETLSLFRRFWARAEAAVDSPGRRFVAITDPGTPLQQLAEQRGFRRTFPAPADVGGRYSALSVFGLVPAALIGVDVHALLDRAWTMAESAAFCVREPHNPCLALGAALGVAAEAGRDKLTLVTTPALAPFGDWLEQLVAESTGKDGKGILPVVGEPRLPAAEYRDDRFFAFVRLEGDDGLGDLEERAAALEADGHPVARIRVADRTQIGQEMFRWEVAVAMAGAVMGIHPFNQPDVQLAKDLAREAMSGAGGPEGVEDTIAVGDHPDDAVEGWLESAGLGDYLCLQAFLAPAPRTSEALTRVREALFARTGLATTAGYGPRFLHSTGQLHKGGPDTGLFLQLVDEPAEELPVPETDYGFAALIRAQALGDYRALRQRGRRALRVDLGRDTEGGLERLLEALSG